MKDLFTQYEDKLIKAHAFMPGGGQFFLLGWLRRELDGFWVLACDPELGDVAAKERIIKCDHISLIELLDKPAMKAEYDARVDAANKAEAEARFLTGKPQA